MTKLKLAILGVGLIGGSFGLALKDKLGDDIFITGTTRTENSYKTAEKMGAIDKGYVDSKMAVQDADIIYLSTPVLQMVPVVQEILPYIKSGAVITDAGSTKQYVADKLHAMLPADIYYVSAHPMAGREKSGVTAATKDLFKNKCYVIIKDDKMQVPEHIGKKIYELIALTEANIVELDLAKHDRCASMISHVPHIAAAALVTLLKHNYADIDDCIKLAGGGFKDTTRIASSNADMWADICISNPAAIINNLKTMQEIINNVITAIDSKDRDKLYDYFSLAKKTRDQVINETKDIYEIE
ncbi:prephenate dehydrogenase [Pectinatus brassicae]|uniref:Prephenate dehydrogenase n=1 Tax=Pectinatus brassicae TaxID=862415 RepID=A0A840ULK4_9FIRM|nr:prephenate dehydrogenase/arogenate dehydrogenase family protein [Pectinatus brassicae]MBB5335578.1 prephenate dehydrogenase [Pectinatus brassicae]